MKQELGRGSFGVVWEGFDTEKQTKCAIKFVWSLLFDISNRAKAKATIKLSDKSFRSLRQHNLLVTFSITHLIYSRLPTSAVDWSLPRKILH